MHYLEKKIFSRLCSHKSESRLLCTVAYFLINVYHMKKKRIFPDWKVWQFSTRSHALKQVLVMCARVQSLV